MVCSFLPLPNCPSNSLEPQCGQHSWAPPPPPTHTHMHIHPHPHPHLRTCAPTHPPPHTVPSPRYPTSPRSPRSPKGFKQAKLNTTTQPQANHNADHTPARTHTHAHAPTDMYGHPPTHPPTHTVPSPRLPQSPRSPRPPKGFKQAKPNTTTAHHQAPNNVVWRQNSAPAPAWPYNAAGQGQSVRHPLGRCVLSLGFALFLRACQDARE